MDYLSKKETLVYLAFTVDALNTLVTFPLFAAKGPKWMLANVHSASGDTIPQSEADRESFKTLWELFMVCYEGYFGFTISTLVCIYRFPETVPVFAYSLFALYLCKAMFLWKRYMKKGNTIDAQTKSKFRMVLFFFLPCYGGFSVLHALKCLRQYL